MKLERIRAEGEPVAPSYDLLRASLAAAQAATPTALANTHVHRRARQVAALSGLLGQLVAEDERQFWRKGSFYQLEPLASEPPL